MVRSSKNLLPLVEIRSSKKNYFQQIAVSLNDYEFLEDLTTVDQHSWSVATDLASNQVERIPTAQVMGLCLK